MDVETGVPCHPSYYEETTMKIHKVAIIRNRVAEFKGGRRYTRCGIEVHKKFTRREWRGVTCRNCLRTKV